MLANDGWCLSENECISFMFYKQQLGSRKSKYYFFCQDMITPFLTANLF